MPPTPNPRKKSIKHKLQKLKARLDNKPKTVVMASVIVKGIFRPRVSEKDPQKKEPNVIPVNNALDKLPIHRSDTSK